VNGKTSSGVLKDVIVVKDLEMVAVDFTPTEAGLLLFHCHEQMHMDDGFKSPFRSCDPIPEGGRLDRWLCRTTSIALSSRTGPTKISPPRIEK